MLTFIHKAFSAHLHLVYLTGGAYIATRQLQYTAIVTTRQLHDTETVLRMFFPLFILSSIPCFINVYRQPVNFMIQNRPENIPFPLILSSIPCFINVCIQPANASCWLCSVTDLSNTWYIVDHLLGTYVFPSKRIRYIFINLMFILLFCCVRYHRGRYATNCCIVL